MSANPSFSPLPRRVFLRAGAGVWLGAAALRAAQDNPFAYDVSRYRKVDPKLIGYEKASEFRVARAEPRRLIVGPGGRLYIAGSNGISILDRDGGAVAEVAAEGAVRAVGVAADGTVYAGLRDHVEVFDRNGQRTSRWETVAGRPFLTALAVTEKHVFAADSGNRVILRFDPSGKLAGRIGERDPQREVKGFIVPSPYLCVVVGPDGLLRVNNPGRHQVETYTEDGDLEMSWGKPSMGLEGFCGCCNPVGLAVLADGRCVTFEKGLPRVKVYGVGGGLESVVAGPDAFADVGRELKVAVPEDGPHGGLDGAVDAEGRVYVMDLISAKVGIFKRKAAG